MTQSQDLPDFEIADEQVNREVAQVVSAVAAAVRSGEVNRTEALVLLSDRIYPVADKDPDVLDATVREAIMRELNPVLEHAGFAPMVPWEF